MATTLETPFGTFTGKNGAGAVQYLGIKYASLKDQLAVPELVERYGDDVIEGSEFGPRAPAMDGCQYEQNVLIQQSIDTPKAPPMCGLECLNLNITVPDIETKKSLPVMVFIHGGGYIMGGNWWPQYDQARLVRFSVKNGSPVIAVNFNYRLGVLGNLTSDELRKAGYPGNNSLRDQKCALQWIKAHIAGFGGDPDNVTAFGESAGAASVLSQLFSKEQLFKRAISMSGTPIMLKPLPTPVTEMAYGMILKELGLENGSVDERIERLRTITPEELVAKTPLTVPLVPFLDGDIVPSMTTFLGLSNASHPAPGREWCAAIMVGDCQHDGNVFAYMGLEQRKSGIAKAFCASLTQNVSSSVAAEAVLQAYNISPTTADGVAYKAIIDFGTDVAYYIPAVAFAQYWPGKAYYYHFNEPNPWDGPFKGCATHMLDAAFLFQNYNDKLSRAGRELAELFAKDLITFVHGNAPWKEYNKEEGTVQSFGLSETSVSAVLKSDGLGHDRQTSLFQLHEEGIVDLDNLSLAWDKFLAGQ